MTYQIKITPNYYQGTINAPQTHFATKSEIEDTEPSYWDEIAEFETMEEAENALAEFEGNGPYYLAHGEAGRPDYEIVEDFGGIEHCIEGSYDNEIDRSDVPTDILDKLESANVEHSREYDDSHDTYSYYIDDDDNDLRYGIHFTVSTIAIQIHSDDLGGIDWGNEIFTKEDI